MCAWLMYVMYFAYNIPLLGVREALEKNICMEFFKAEYSRNDEQVMRVAYGKFVMPVYHQTILTDVHKM